MPRVVRGQAEEVPLVVVVEDKAGLKADQRAEITGRMVVMAATEEAEVVTEAAEAVVVLVAVEIVEARRGKVVAEVALADMAGHRSQVKILGWLVRGDNSS